MTYAHLGLITGLLAALFAAATGLLVRGISAPLHPVSLNAWRCTVAAIIFLPLWLIWNSAGLPNIYGILWIAVAVTFSIVIGDSSYFLAIKKLGVAKAMPIAKSYPAFAVVFSFFIFGESLGLIKIVGVILAITGTTLMSQQSKVIADPLNEVDQSHASRNHWTGVAIAIGTAIAWALGAVVLKQSLTKADVITVSLVKTIIAAAMLWSISARVDAVPVRKRITDRKSFVLATATGFTLAGAALTSVYSIQYAGAGVGSVYSGLAPLFTIPLGVLIFKERMSLLAVVGAISTIAGVICVSMS